MESSDKALCYIILPKHYLIREGERGKGEGKRDCSAADGSGSWFISSSQSVSLSFAHSFTNWTRNLVVLSGDIPLQPLGHTFMSEMHMLNQITEYRWNTNLEFEFGQKSPNF